MTAIKMLPVNEFSKESAKVSYLPTHTGDGYNYGGGAVLTIGRHSFQAGEGAAIFVAEEIEQRWNSALALYAALSEILYYSGGAENALEDEYVMERAREALAKAKGEVQP